MEKARVLDANIVLRFLTNDVPEQADRCAALLKRVENAEEEVFLPDLVLADIVWVLEKFYHQPKQQIRDLLNPLLSLRSLRFSNKKTARKALEIYASKNLDWSDAFTVAQMLIKNQREIYSYDKDFNKLEGLTRLEP